MMSEVTSPENKRPRRSLSLSKNKKKNEAEVKGATPIPSASSSILSFFNNTPPAKVTCPMCGQMVPRYGINKHIDEMCQKNHEDGEMILVDTGLDCFLNQGQSCIALNTSSSPYFAKEASTSEKNESIFESSLLKIRGGAGQQTSPYFKKNNAPMYDVQNEPRVQMVKSISLGNLSSKLSRRRRIQSRQLIEENKKNSSTPAVHSVCDNAAEWGDGETCAGDGSQKENHFVLVGFQKQLVPKDSLTKELASQGETRECDKETLVGSAHGFVSSVRIVARELVSAEGNTEKHSCSEGMVPNLGKHTTHPASYNKVERSDGSEAKTQFSVKDITPSRAQVAYESHTENCLVTDNTGTLPMEVHEDLRNEMIYHTFSEPMQEVDFQNTAGDILDKISGALGSATDSFGHPYYLQNFLMVLQMVLENHDDRRLFDEQDTSTIAKFYQLSESELQDLSEGLDLLSAPELKTLAKTFHLKNPNGQKQQLVEDFLRLAKQRSIFSKNQAGIGAVILKRAKDLSGKSVRVCKGPRAVFSRVLLLFSLTDSMEDEEAASGGQGQLSTVLMVNMGRTVFPSYTVNRKIAIFQDREDFIRYATAAHLSNDVAIAMANGNWTEAKYLYMCAKETWHELKNHPSLRCHRDLPEYLRHFTVGWMYTRILSRGVEILQRLHMYEEAVEELQNLLSQEVYCTDSRGRWWDRLALNLHQHLKRTEQAIECIRKGLSDPFVRTGHQLSLYQRALRLRDSPSCKKFRSLFQELPVITVEDVTHVTIKGKMCPQTGVGKSVFLVEDDDDQEEGEDFTMSTIMCSVEELALTHYRQNGFDQGIHGEGSTFSTLYSLLMWDIIFMDGIPDVFRNSYQAFPLDLYTDSFYEKRKDAIESRLQLLYAASSETLKEMIANVWNAQEGKAAALVSWDRFTSLQQAQSLVSCFGGPFLSGVCRRLSKDLRHCRGGLPDLVVWSTQEHRFKLVEVKGPNDRLSYKQMIWLGELKKLGAAVEVCHVAAVGAKSKRLS
ncbi:fanconi-associated nuclease 1 isoform X2 [Dermochelys coriacea]|uniref:fanconi-associated nuclease 1 isoform X2 n=1 Tax=Dermochelys coriacea TaxID=27794 RepID=UPI001CA83C36|nr:fanconi-associated nuclease 1 isoform X2 [Dermochelys coriacea]XP_043349766.1 fanconi-associated nuclease 1 isoform X2 [Dermochelys coriacea]